MPMQIPVTIIQENVDLSDVLSNGFPVQWNCVTLLHKNRSIKLAIMNIVANSLQLHQTYDWFNWQDHGEYI